MNDLAIVDLERRRFLGRCLATGTGLCLGGCALSRALAGSPGRAEDAPARKHKFQEDAGLSYERVMQIAYAVSYIPIMKVLAENVGLDALQAAAEEAAARRVAGMAGRLPGHELADFASFFRNPSPFLAHALTKTVIEDSDRAFEIEVTECLWAKVFRESDAAELGHRCICRADYATARAFNPRIELVRDRTLMQGHDRCNHRYVVRL